MKIRNFLDISISVAKIKEHGQLVLLIGPKDHTFFEDGEELNKEIIGKPKIKKNRKNLKEWETQEVII